MATHFRTILIISLLTVLILILLFVLLIFFIIFVSLIIMICKQMRLQAWVAGVLAAGIVTASLDVQYKS